MRPLERVDLALAVQVIVGILAGAAFLAVGITAVGATRWMLVLQITGWLIGLGAGLWNLGAARAHLHGAIVLDPDATRAPTLRQTLRTAIRIGSPAVVLAVFVGLLPSLGGIASALVFMAGAPALPVLVEVVRWQRGRRETLVVEPKPETYVPAWYLVPDAMGAAAVPRPLTAPESVVRECVCAVSPSPGFHTGVLRDYAAAVAEAYDDGGLGTLELVRVGIERLEELEQTEFEARVAVRSWIRVIQRLPGVDRPSLTGDLTDGEVRLQRENGAWRIADVISFGRSAIDGIFAVDVRRNYAQFDVVVPFVNLAADGIVVVLVLRNKRDVPLRLTRIRSAFRSPLGWWHGQGCQVRGEFVAPPAGELRTALRFALTPSPRRTTRLRFELHVREDAPGDDFELELEIPLNGPAQPLRERTTPDSAPPVK